MKEHTTIIYKITNRKNGKIYVGRTITTTTLRLKRHCWASKRGDTYLGRAIQKHGKEAFHIEPLEEVSADQANARETWWIHELRSYVSDVGYNLSWGSNGGSSVGKTTRKLLGNASQKFWNSMTSEERSALLRQRMTGLKKSPEHAANLSKSKAGRASTASKTSKFVGVSLHRTRDRFYWIATCYLNGAQHTRTLPDEKSAAACYDRFALALHGPTARLNFTDNREVYLAEDLGAYLLAGKTPKSRYRYVSYQAASRLWCVFYRGKYYGKSRSEEAAAVIASAASGLAISDLIRSNKKTSHLHASSA